MSDLSRSSAASTPVSPHGSLSSDRHVRETWQPPVAPTCEVRVDAFDAAELEFIADGLDVLVELSHSVPAAAERFGTVNGLLSMLARRARAQADVLVKASTVEDPDLDAAVNAEGEVLSARYGRCAVLRLDAGHFLVCGLADDHEMMWRSVRRLGAEIVTVDATPEDMQAARARLSALSGVSA